ncbi:MULTISPECIES: hypothetical protein [unclassified Micromonospora]|uniref:hypothetical protein n=1 Tax=unclassified Micromonospora TaxID=2617518 RepID=UPI0036402D7D
MNRPVRASWATVPTEEERYRPLYARALGLRFVNPGGVLCFLFFEGAVSLAALLALAELVTWWAVLVLPAAVAVMVKLNDMVAEVVVRTAALVPEQERDRFRRQLEPVVGRATVRSVAAPSGSAGAPGRSAGATVRSAGGHAGATGARGRVAISGVRAGGQRGTPGMDPGALVGSEFVGSEFVGFESKPRVEENRPGG